MTISSALIDLVPIGEENAATGLVLWKQLGVWSPTSIKHTLNDMAEAGLIERKWVQRGAGDVSLYFRPRRSG